MRKSDHSGLFLRKCGGRNPSSGSPAPGVQSPDHTLRSGLLGLLSEPQFSHLQSRVCASKRNKGQAGIRADLLLCGMSPREKAWKRAAMCIG